MSAPALLIPATSKNFDGVGNGFSGPSGTFTVNAAPPDTNGDVGPNHYVQTVNTDFAVFNKRGTPVYGPVPINTLWSGFGGDCQTNNDGDPVVQLCRPIAAREPAERQKEAHECNHRRRRYAILPGNQNG